MDQPEANSSNATKAAQSSSAADESAGASEQPQQNRWQSNRSNNQRPNKRKNDFPDSSLRFGGRGGRHDNKRHKKGDMGRGEYFASQPDRRQRNQDAKAKREREGGRAPGQGVQFSKEEIDAEERRPKRKVAVMIGYSGTGYKGMQISGTEKTIEGDLFKAFIQAGAISKANAEDPKKSSLVRCARTDKGVHAAGNMISLKLIVEDEDIVEKINKQLSPQIRVWGIERTIGSFSCYQACDSRWYEYLIPSYAFLPPHTNSWLAKQITENAGEGDQRDSYNDRQAEVKGFWERIDEEIIKPILDSFDDDTRSHVIKALEGEDEATAVKGDAGVVDAVKIGDSIEPKGREIYDEKTEDATIVINEPAAQSAEPRNGSKDEPGNTERPGDALPSPAQPTDAEVEKTKRLRAAVKSLRQAYVTAKRHYRIPAQRVDRIQQALHKYVGTKNYHNYTIQKAFKDPSVNRHIKSFVVNKKPILIGDGPDEDKTEWLSLKVHGQSFMMHQIRKMVGMVTLMVRSGSDLKTMDDSFTDARFSIPKVPGLGLLLERPVFDSYNNLQAPKHEREPLIFSKYEAELEAFKEREIYQRIFREEAEKNEFEKFFNHIDNSREPYFLYVTGKGIEATKDIVRKGPAAAEVDSDAEGDANGEEG